MGVTSTGNEEQEAQPAKDAGQHPADAVTAVQTPARAPADPPTTQLLAGSVGDRCAKCGTPLASDQRYCVNCGERRGTGRFATASVTGPVATVTETTGPPPQPNRPWYSGATLIAGIATLLLAMGVGVLIGKAGNNNAKTGTSQVITVNGGGATGAATGATGAAGTGAAAAGAHHAAKASHAPKTEAAKAKQAASSSKPTTAAVKKASHAASSVLGGSGGQSQATVKTGASCKAGSAGCQGGHFTGNFFGQ